MIYNMYDNQLMHMFNNDNTSLFELWAMVIENDVDDQTIIE